MTQKQNYRVKFRSELWDLGFRREADVGEAQKRDVRSCQGWSYSRWEAPNYKLRAEQMWGLCGECGDLICVVHDRVKLNSKSAILCKLWHKQQTRPPRFLLYKRDKLCGGPHWLHLIPIPPLALPYPNSHLCLAECGWVKWTHSYDISLLFLVYKLSEIHAGNSWVQAGYR